MTTANTCHWCGAEVTDTSAPCQSCGLHPVKRDQKKETPAEKKQAKERRAIPRTAPWDFTPQGKPVIGIDPGARYTGVVVRDGDVVLYATTVVMPPEVESPLDYARTVIAFVRKEVISRYPDAPIGVEGLSDPKGYVAGKRAPINPKYVMKMAAVAGGVVVAFPNAIEIKPGGNGSQHISNYPKILIGTRAKDLPGAEGVKGPRSHEQSAYDVAGKAAKIFYQEEQEN